MLMMGRGFFPPFGSKLILPYKSAIDQVLAMETRNRKRNRITGSGDSGSYEKKLNVDITSMQIEFETNNTSRSKRKRAVVGPSGQGRRKRMKNTSIIQSSTAAPDSSKYLKLEIQDAIVLEAIAHEADGNSITSLVSSKVCKEEVAEEYPIIEVTTPESSTAGSHVKRNDDTNISSESVVHTDETNRRRPSTTVSLKPPKHSNISDTYPRSLIEAAVVAQKVKKAASSKIRSSKLETLGRWWKTVFVIMSISMVIHAIYSKQPFEKDCIYVNGGGFGGFWFILGQLYKLHKESKIKNYVCYSAGCIGAVSILANRTFEDLYDSALGIQTNWKKGSISRFDALGHFVDDLLGNSSDLDISTFSNVHILTSVPKSGGWEVHRNIAEDIEHLKTLLVQTAWIPFITGDHIWHPSTGHMDGGFSRLQHPTCNIHVSLPWDWKLLVNTMNINMPKEEGNRYWELGLNYDI